MNGPALGRCGYFRTNKLNLVGTKACTSDVTSLTTSLATQLFATVASTVLLTLAATACGPTSASVATGVSPTAPTLGRKWRPNQSGYGEVKPSVINNGGDPTGIVSTIRWTGWGGSTATGHGTAAYQAPGRTAVDARQEPAVVVTYDLGSCGGKLVYRKLTWYFPREGESFNANSYFDICTGASS